jgi:hypothetical protein
MPATEKVETGRSQFESNPGKVEESLSHKGWGHDSQGKYLVNKCKTLCSIPSSAKKEEKKGNLINKWKTKSKKMKSIINHWKFYNMKILD